MILASLSVIYQGLSNKSAKHSIPSMKKAAPIEAAFFVLT
jgi:hypothetical protein